MPPFAKSDIIRFNDDDDMLFFHQKAYQDLFLPNSLEPKGSPDRGCVLRVDMRQLRIDMSVIQEEYGPFEGIIVYGKSCDQTPSRYPVIKIGFGEFSTTLRNKTKRVKENEATDVLNIAISCNTNKFRRIMSDATMDTVKDKTDKKRLKTWINGCNIVLVPKDIESSTNSEEFDQTISEIKDSGVLLAGNFPYTMDRYYNWDLDIIRSCEDDCKKESEVEESIKEVVL